MVWSGEIGHIAVFIEGNVDTFKSFDQNYPLGSPCHIQGHTYANVLGWLRFKKTENMPEDEIIKRADAFVTVCSLLNKPVDKDIVIADIKRLLELEDKLRERDNELDKKRQEIENLSAKLVELTNDKKRLENENEQQQRRLSDLTREFTDVQARLEELKDLKPLADYSVKELIAKIFIKIFRSR